MLEQPVGHDVAAHAVQEVPNRAGDMGFQFGLGTARLLEIQAVIVPVADDDRPHDVADQITQRVGGGDLRRGCAAVAAHIQRHGAESRRIVLRDPEGNLVNFFTPVTDGAIRRATEN
jgi:hypothetical protein